MTTSVAQKQVVELGKFIGRDRTVATEIVVEQGSQEWLDARVGRATASRFGDILATIRSGESALRRNYKVELIIEQIKHQPYERYRSKEMEFGSETEELAAIEYMLKTGNQVKTCGFFQHNTIMAGASPDRLVGDHGQIEIKCLNSANHYDVLQLGKMPDKHLPQVQGQMWMTGRDWCDFVSYDPDIPGKAQIFIQRIIRDQDYIDMLDREVRQFLLEVENGITFIQNYGKETSHA